MKHSSSCCLKNNADVNIQDNNGYTPLHVCAVRDCLDISKLLIQSGCNINLPNVTGKTPLHLAISERNETLVKILLENDARGSKSAGPSRLSRAKRAIIAKF